MLLTRWILLFFFFLTLGLSGCSTMTPSEPVQASETTPATTTTELASQDISVQPEPEGNVWSEMHQDFKLPDESRRPEVKKKVQFYLAHPEQIAAATDQGSPYIYYILAEIRKRGLPGELSLLPLVESAYDPYAYNKESGATGLWQFKRKTALGYNMQQNWWYDQRRDILASTQAALDYLAYLNDYFEGDWLLAIAAYDAGQGTIKKAIKRNQRKHLPTDFWHLKLTKEAKEYVPKLLALSTILARPTFYSVNPAETPNRPYLTTVKINTQVDLAKAAQAADLDMTDFYKLNPSFNHSITAPSTDANIVIPIEKEEQFRENIAEQISLSAMSTPASFISEVKPEVNHLVNKLNLLEYLNNTKIIHRIKSGETLSSIANRYRVSIENLVRWNRLKLNTVLKIGEKIIIYLGK